MKNPYEEEAARYMKVLQSFEPIINELALTTPPPPRPLTRRERKMTPTVIRRCIADLRSGVVRPIDPTKDPNALADELEGELKIMALLEQSSTVLEQLRTFLMSKLENRLQNGLPAALRIYREARKLARTSGDEQLKEHVRHMTRALRGPRRRRRVRR
ncbi:MAG TPA: hypothetical protein VHX14_15650 [Thermoanaerobaculia bacterium]|nr:hypothetical protein [Thermoanaerobaculia bacterium]